EGCDNSSNSSPGQIAYPVPKTAIFFFDEDGDITTSKSGLENNLDVSTCCTSQLKRKNESAGASSGYNTEEDKEDQRGPSKIPRRIPDTREMEKKSSSCKEKQCIEDVRLNAEAQDALSVRISTPSQKIEKVRTPPIVVEMWDSMEPSDDTCEDNQKSVKEQLLLCAGQPQSFSREEREPTPFLPGPPENSKFPGAFKSSAVTNRGCLSPPAPPAVPRFERESTPTPEFGRKKYKAHAAHHEPKETTFQREATPFLADCDLDLNKHNDHIGLPQSLTLSVPNHHHIKPDLLGAETN
ncbi:hypothetical protein EGW08_017914, partial [Elysia chlorotica]